VITTLLLHALNVTGPGDRITLDDIEARFRELTGSATSSVEKVKMPIIGGGITALVLLLVLFYLLGRRKGRKRATVLEIRRIV
jgi:hypothetical protein